MSRPNPALPCLQRQDMSRSPETPRLRLLAREQPTRNAPIVRADARADFRCVRVYGDGVSGAVRIRVVRHHLRQLQLRGACDGDWSADVAGGVPDHERGFGGGEVFGGDYEVAFVLAGGGVEDYDEFAAGWEGVVSWRYKGRKRAGMVGGPKASIVSGIESKAGWEGVWEVPLMEGAPFGIVVSVGAIALKDT